MVDQAINLSAAPNGIVEDFYSELKLTHGYKKSAPIVEGDVQLKDENFTLLGLDIFAENSFRSVVPAVVQNWLGELVTQPDAVLIIGSECDSIEYCNRRFS